nr:hypothetical protein [uncultured Acidovorax sp.]
MLKPMLFACFVLVGCGETEPVQVLILPSQYQVGEFKSQLATPVVEEVVRLQPKSIHISACKSTPHAKIIQFDVELRARLQPQVTLGHFEDCPER